MPVLRCNLIALFILAFSLCAGSALAQDNGESDLDSWELGVTVGADLRLFIQDPAYGLDKDTFSPSLWFEPSLSYSFPNGDDFLQFRMFARADANDSDRSHFDVREAYWLHQGDGWDVLTGVNIVYWGVTEACTIGASGCVDIINQTDWVEDVDGGKKLGQPMINANIYGDWGRFSAFVLPGFRARTHPDNDSRFRGPIPTDDDRIFYKNDAGGTFDARVDFAARYENTMGPVDFGVSHFYGMSRDPIYRLTIGDNFTTVAGQYYQVINQTGIDVSAAFGDFLLKAEGVAINGYDDNIEAFGVTRDNGDDDWIIAGVVGVEYTVVNPFESGGDLYLIAEYTYDDRDNRRAPPTVFDNDILLGTRFNLNDVNDFYFEGGVLIDLDHDEQAAYFNMSRRMTDNLKMAIEGRFFRNGHGSFEDGGDPVVISAVNRDDYVALKAELAF